MQKWVGAATAGLTVLTLATQPNSIAAQAQTPSAPLAFDVASVKTNRLDDRIVTIDIGPGPRFMVRGYTLVLLMQRAYGVMDWNVDGGPSWIRSDRFDVNARATTTGDLTEPQLQTMLKGLLAERFALRVHNGVKQEAGYALTVARGGPKLTPSADGAEHPDTFRLTNIGLVGQGITMDNFARFFAGKLGLIAVNLTGLRGSYDVKADWTVQPMLDTGGLPVDPREPLRAAAYTAIEDQLGLKISPQRIDVPTVVIDRVDHPTED